MYQKRDRASVGPERSRTHKLPPNGCTFKRASAVASAASVAPDHAHTAAANASTTTKVPKTHGQRRRARRGERGPRDKKGEGADPTAIH